MTGLTVQDVMTTKVAAVRTHTPFKEVARVLAEWRVSALPVLDENDRLVGVVSEADLLPKEEYHGEYQDQAGTRLLASPRRHAAERTKRAKVSGDTAGALMTSPAITIRPAARVAEVARTMDSAGVKRLPVIDAEGTLVGIVTRADLLKVFLRSDEEIREEVVREVFLRLLWADATTVDVEVRDGVVILTGELPQKSGIPIAVHLTRAVDGVVDVVNRLIYLIDDTGKGRGQRVTP